jgi:hypothetical protein
MMCAQSRDALDASEVKLRLPEAAGLPGRIEQQLKGWDETMQRVAYECRKVKNFLFLGNLIVEGVHR